MEATVLVANALPVSAEQTKVCRTSHIGAISTHGTKSAANASSHIKVEETLMPSITTQTDQLMLDFGKSTTSIGANAAKERPHAILKSTWHVRSNFTNGEAIVSSYGKLTLPVDADFCIHLIIGEKNFFFIILITWLNYKHKKFKK